MHLLGCRGKKVPLLANVLKMLTKIKGEITIVRDFQVCEIFNPEAILNKNFRKRHDF